MRLAHFLPACNGLRQLPIGVARRQIGTRCQNLDDALEARCVIRGADRPYTWEIAAFFLDGAEMLR